MGFNFNRIVKKVKKQTKKLSKSVDNKIKYLKDKRKILDSLTNKELKKVYRDFVSSDLKKEYRDIKTDKLKKRDMTRSEIQRSLQLRVALENIISSVPRLKKKALELEKKIK